MSLLSPPPPLWCMTPIPDRLRCPGRPEEAASLLLRFLLLLSIYLLRIRPGLMLVWSALDFPRRGPLCVFFALPYFSPLCILMNYFPVFHSSLSSAFSAHRPVKTNRSLVFSLFLLGSAPFTTQSDPTPFFSRLFEPPPPGPLFCDHALSALFLFPGPPDLFSVPGLYVHDVQLSRP